MNQNTEIRILDVIIHQSAYSKQAFVVVDRKPEFVYEQHGNKLIAHDSGFYDSLQIEPGSRDAFAGREFTIRLADGTDYQCHGQVWDQWHPELVSEPVVQVGVATLEQLQSCYVFGGGRISTAKLNAWLASRTPSRNYYKYDPRETVEHLDSVYEEHSRLDRIVCAKRARKLRRRGVTIRRKADGGRGWSPSYERRKAQILARKTLDALEVAP